MDSPFHTPRHIRPRDDSDGAPTKAPAIDLLPGRSRVAFAVTLPLLMIATSIHIQKISNDASMSAPAQPCWSRAFMEPDGSCSATTAQIHEANYALLNRT